MKKLINIDLLPNFEKDDEELIEKILKGYEDLKAKREVELELRKYFPQGEILFFGSAREALTFFLSILKKIDSRQEVLTQAFSCLVVPNAIKFANLQPIFVDIGDDFNFDLEDLKSKIGYNSLALIIQNTFGIPAKIKEILDIAKERNIFVIENLTHAFGAKYENTYLGNFGDASILSFNRNKVISSIIGGALIIRNDFLKKDCLENYKNLNDWSNWGVKKLLWGTKILLKIKKYYHLKITKGIAKILRFLEITPEMIKQEEKQGIKPKNYLRKFPDNLFPLLLNQLKKLEKFNNQRRKIAQLYINSSLLNFNFQGEPIFLRFPVFSKLKKEILENFKKDNIYLGDWYDCVLAPCGNNLEIFGYQKKDCPRAEEISQVVFNLPTLISEDEAYLIVDKLKKWLK